MTVQQVVALCQITSALLGGIGYFVPKEQLEKFDHKAKRIINSLVNELKNISIPDIQDSAWFQGCGGLIAVVLIVALIGSRVFHSSLFGMIEAIARAGFIVFYYLFIALGALGILLTVLLLMIIGFLRFVIWCPKGVIAGITFPLFLIATAYQIYKWVSP